MKKFFKIFFIILGVIFLLLIVAGGYLYFSGTLAGLGLVGDYETYGSIPNAPSEAVDANPALSNSQENALRAVGVDTATLPTSITPELEACFIGKLGQKRVDEIVVGAAPTPLDLLKGAGCVE